MKYQVKPFMDIKSLNVGYKVLVQKNQIKQKAEILGIRNIKIEKNKNDLSKQTDSENMLEFYVHYIDLNRRLDEWIPQSCIILETIETPKKKKKEDQIEAKKYEDECKIKNIKKLKFGKWIVEPWYFSPYPLWVTNTDMVYICEFCLYYFKNEDMFVDHKARCTTRHPPGREIYRNSEISFFELDGYTEQKFCRNLALLSKLFLDHKSLYYDIDVFLFYVLCRIDSSGYSIVGYFSKEKISEQGYNLACILTLPFEQRKGYGKILIDFSYMLSKKGNLISGPEKPLSDLGLLSYRAYWLEVVVSYLLQNTKANISDISKATYITPEDIISTLNHYGILKLYKGKFVYALSKEHRMKGMRYLERCLKEEHLKKDCI